MWVIRPKQDYFKKELTIILRLSVAQKLWGTLQTDDCSRTSRKALHSALNPKISAQSGGT
jgi:hypothetical protein